MNCFKGMRLHSAARMWLVAAVMLLVTACGAKTEELIILHTNDSHGSIFPVDSMGGLAERATFIRQVREKYPNVLLLDAGDFNAGQPVSDLADAEPDILAYNYMGYDAVALGNHEFDKPLSVLQKQMGWASFPFVTSNVTLHGKPLGKEYVILPAGKLRVGVFGLTTKYTKDLSVNAGEEEFADEMPTARRMVELLRKEKVDIIVCLAHLGFTETTSDFITSRKLVAAVPGIDVVIDGHSHSYITTPERLDSTWIVTANHSGNYVGMAKIGYAGGKIRTLDWKPVPIRGFAPDTAVLSIIRPFAERAQQDLSTVVGKASAEFLLYKDGVNMTRHGETALGDLVADALVWKARELGLAPDFGLTNSGGIRQSLPGGEVTKGNVLAVLPFSNTLEVVTLKGSDVRRLFDFIASVRPGAGAFAQVSEEVRTELDRKTGKAVSLLIGGKPIDDGATYRMATCNYIAEGKDGYDIGLSTGNPREYTSRLLSEVVADYIGMKGTVIPRTDGRIRMVP